MNTPALQLSSFGHVAEAEVVDLKEKRLFVHDYPHSYREECILR